jgi:hypothetical protein
LSIQFEKWQLPRFVINLEVEPPEGIEAVIAPGGESVTGRLKPRSGPSTRSWFRADRPWWQRIISRGPSDLANEAVDECIRLLPEVETWWTTQSSSEHITCLTFKFVGSQKAKGKDSSIVSELKTKGYIGRARERARRRKSPWNLILIPLVVLGIFSVSIGQFSLLWHLNTWVYPEHIGRLKNIMRSNEHQVSQMLLTLPCLFSAIPLGMLLANCMAWCIPPARRTFEREARGIAHASFRASMSDLGKFALFIVPICLALGVIGALTLR